MSTFVDTSALLPMLTAEDQRHTTADALWRSPIASNEPLVCTSYLLLETFALVQNRLGMDAVRVLREDIFPGVGIVWVTAELHEAGVSALLATGRRQLSLVDCVSFEVMRRMGIRRVFAFDAHFEEQGFEGVASAPEGERRPDTPTAPPARRTTPPCAPARPRRAPCTSGTGRRA